MASAAAAPSPPASAMRLSFALRADTNAVSAAVRIPFATMRSPRISSSFAAFGMDCSPILRFPADAIPRGAGRAATQSAL
jgi:hypothetical protein